METPDSSSRPPLVGGTLYVVATPIGNLEDITLRALRTLRDCDLVAAEDTRRTGMLLKHFELRKPMISCFQHNEARRGGQILEALQEGRIVALVSDAGTPGISDPGMRVVAAVRAAGFRVEPVPGACAAVAALSASGFPTDAFHFIGFLPHKSGQRRRLLEGLKEVPGTWILYESPYRVRKLLEELRDLYPNRQVGLAREVTKRHEEWLEGLPEALLETYRQREPKGEFVVLVGPEKLPLEPVSPETSQD